MLIVATMHVFLFVFNFQYCLYLITRTIEYAYAYDKDIFCDVKKGGRNKRFSAIKTFKPILYDIYVM